MKLSTALIAGAVVAGTATTAMPAHATHIVGQVFESYNYSSGDSGSIYVHSLGAALTNVCIDGTCGLSAPPGGDTAAVNFGDPEFAFNVAISGRQFAPTVVTWQDYDTSTTQLIGTLTGVPEPASMAVLGVSLLGLGLARRRKS